MDNQWHIFRQGKEDGITVWLSNSPWGRCRAPFALFVIFFNGKFEIDCSSYENMRDEVHRIKMRIKGMKA